MNKKGLTFVEIMVVVAIIAVLASAILVSVEQSRKKARINGVKTSVRGALPAIISCKDGGGTVRIPVGSESGNNNPVCTTNVGLNGANWPPLYNGYYYGTLFGPPVSVYDSSNCNFRIFTNNDITQAGNNYLTCNCASGQCD